MGQILDGVDVVVGRWGNQGDARNGVACLGDNFVHFETRKLPAFPRLGTLGHFDLYLFGMDEVFGRDTETSGSHLFGLAAKRDAFVRFVETAAVFAAFPRVASGTEFVHGQCQGFVRFLADGAERHGTGDEMLDDVLHGFHLVDVDGVALEPEEVAQEYRSAFPVRHSCELLEFLVTAEACGNLQGGYGLRGPSMLLAILAEREKSDVGQEMPRLCGPETCIVEGGVVFCDFLQPYAADGRDRRAEIGFQQFLAESYGFEYLGTPVRTNRADAHLAHYLVQAFADGLDVVLFRRFVVHLYFIPLDQIVQYGKSHIGVDGTCPVAQQQGGVHDLTDFPAFDNQGGLYTFLYGNQMVVYGTYGQQ